MVVFASNGTHFTNSEIASMIILRFLGFGCRTSAVRNSSTEPKSICLASHRAPAHLKPFVSSANELRWPKPLYSQTARPTDRLTDRQVTALSGVIPWEANAYVCRRLAVPLASSHQLVWLRALVCRLPAWQRLVCPPGSISSASLVLPGSASLTVPRLLADTILHQLVCVLLTHEVCRLPA